MTHKSKPGDREDQIGIGLVACLNVLENEERVRAVESRANRNPTANRTFVFTELEILEIRLEVGVVDAPA